MNNRKILYVWDSDYPWDVRVEKICLALAKDGYEVHIAARNLKRLPRYEKIDGLHIHRLKTYPNQRLNYIASFPLFFSPIWLRFLARIVQSQRIDLIIVRDLPLAAAAIRVGSVYQVPVVFDMAENYVAMIRDIWKARKFQGFNLLVRNPFLAKILETHVLCRIDHVLAVIDEARDLLLSRGVPPEKVTIVSNTPPLEIFGTNNHSSEAVHYLKKMADHYCAVYTGGVQMGRGIQLVFDAIPGLIETIPDFLFVVVGDGYATSRLKEEAIRKGVQDRVLWVGWVEHRQLFDYLRACKIGIIPHLVSDHVNTTIPNKIFDYMGLGLPVIASDAVPMKRILEETQSGITFEAGNYSDLANKIKEMYQSDFEYRIHGIEAVKTKYNWGNDERRLIASLRNLRD